MTSPVDQTFVSGTTISSSWLNGANDHVNDLNSTSHSSNSISFTQSGTGATVRSAMDKMQEVVSVKDFGAVGDGVTDDTTAVQAAINYLRTTAEAVADQSGCMTLDFGGAVCKVTSSIDATGIATWGWGIQNGTLVGHCTGKAVLDMTASRGGRLSNFVVSGDATNKPRVGIQSARSTGSGQEAFCDNMYFENVSVNGYFSLSAVYFYGQETTTHINCQYWNYDSDGYAGIHTGYDWETYQSDYKTVITGDTSYINDKYINCDWRHLPISTSAAVTGITKANPCVISFASHPFAVGDSVVITFVSGMDEINNSIATISAATSTTITLSGIDSSSWGTYSSGGMVVKAQTKPTILFGRAHQHSFDTCYVVNYGSDSIQWNFSSSDTTARQITFDFLFEGAGSRSSVRYFSGIPSVNISLLGYTFKTYNTNPRTSIFSTDAAVSETVSFYDAYFSCTNSSHGLAAFLDNPIQYAFFGCDVFMPSRSWLTPTSTYAFYGTFRASSDGKEINWNLNTSYEKDGSFTPVVTSSSGSITSYTAVGDCKRVGELVYVSCDITITNNGTGSGYILISGLPYAAEKVAIMSGRDSGVSGDQLQAIITTGGTTINVFRYNNTYPAVTNARLIVTGVYRAAPV